MTGFIGLSDAKAHARITSDREDGLVQQLIDAASRQVERITGFVAATREARFDFDRFGTALELRLRPVNLATIAVTYLDGEGQEQSVAEVRAIERNGTLRLFPAIGASWPVTGCYAGAVTVTAQVGLGATDEDGAPDAPEDIRHAVRLCVAAWVDDRAEGAIPQAVHALLDDERLRRL